LGRQFLQFVKTTVIGGMLVIIPLAFVLFVLVHAVIGLRRVAELVIAVSGIHASRAWVVVLLASLFLLALCFVTGLLVRTRLGQAVKLWFNNSLAPRIPMLRGISNLTKAFAGLEDQQFVPVEVDLYGTGVTALGFLIEELPDGRRAVFVPGSPVITVGNVVIVPAERITPLPATLGETVGVITQWGIDASSLLRPAAGKQDAAAATGSRPPP
jgi:uncharacterized membrane protein